MSSCLLPLYKLGVNIALMNCKSILYSSIVLYSFVYKGDRRDCHVVRTVRAERVMRGGLTAELLAIII